MLHLRAIDAQLLTLRLSLRTDDGLYPAHDVIDVEPTLLKLHLPAFDARHVQNVVYKLQQMTRRRGDGIEQPAIFSLASPLSRAIFVMPTMALMGVRMSCDMFARNWLFASFDDRAISSACSSIKLPFCSFVRSDSTSTYLSTPLMDSRYNVSWYQRRSPVRA